MADWLTVEVWANATIHQRTIAPVKTRRMCWCGCRRRATHAGFANGICMTAPLCELGAHRWRRSTQPMLARQLRETIVRRLP